MQPADLEERIEWRKKKEGETMNVSTAEKQNTIEKGNKTHKKQEDEESLDEFPTSYEEISLTDNYNDSYEDKEEVLNKDTEKFTSPIKQKPEDIMPLEYHDYLSVFQEKEKPIQPPHRHQHHRIPLMDNRIPPFELCMP
jgi:hypothetical protein